MASVESSKLTLTCALENNCPHLPQGLTIRAVLSLLNPSKSQLSRAETTVPLRVLLWHEVSLTPHCKEIKEPPCAAGDNLLTPACQGPTRAEGDSRSGWGTMLLTLLLTLSHLSYIQCTTFTSVRH